MRNARRWFGMTVLLTLAVSAAACAVARLSTGGFGAGEGTRVSMVTKGRVSARPADYPISLTAEDYQEPYDEIAVIRTHPCGDDMLDTVATAELRDLARQVGADAVLHISRRSETGEEIAYRPGNLLRQGTRFVERSELVGTAVRFKRPETTPK